MAATSGVSRWTRRFAIASAISMVGLQIAFLLEMSLYASAIVGLFGAVLPMTFGMAYLLVPSYVGRTLAADRLPGIHLAVTYLGAGLLLAGEVAECDDWVIAMGAFLWSVGVVIFVGTLCWTVIPVVSMGLSTVRRSSGVPRGAAQFAAIEIAIGYLIVGTAILLSVHTGLPIALTATFPSVVHFYGVGFATVLIFALGARLLPGFFDVELPTVSSWGVLVPGSVAPAVLAFQFWTPPWFAVGAGLATVAMVGYAGTVIVVASRTDRPRIGLYGILLGAIGGVVAVSIPMAGVLGIGSIPFVRLHVPVVLNGFLLVTIVGYAYQFFPVTTGRFRGASERIALSTLLLLALGTIIQASGILVAAELLRLGGIIVTLIATTGYAYLIGRRLW
jgi:hypothetical protein